MKIMIQTPLKNQEIRELLDGMEANGVVFNFVEKQGMGLVFEVNQENDEDACEIAKKAIKGTVWGKVLYFSVKNI